MTDNRQNTDTNSLAALDKSARDLRQRIDTYINLVNNVIDNDLNRGCNAGFCRRAPMGKEERLRKAIIEAISTLEESRKAFKSKTLENLRKRLITVLIE